MELTHKDLDRLEKNGVGGFTTKEELDALIKLARIALRFRELFGIQTEREE